MKRSEALILIANQLDFIKGSFDGFKNDHATLEMGAADVILTTLETAGMSPPPLQPWDELQVVYDDFSSPTGLYYYKGIRIKPDLRTIWEPETDDYCGAV